MNIWQWSGLPVVLRSPVMYTRLHIRLPVFARRKTLTQQGSLVRQVATLPKGVISITSANDLFRLAETQYKLARFLQEQSVNTMLTFSELLCVSIPSGRSSCFVLFLVSPLYDSVRTPVKSTVQHIAKPEAGYASECSNSFRFLQRAAKAHARGHSRVESKQ